MDLKQIYKDLHNKGEAEFNNISMIYDMGSVEVSKNNTYLFTATSWAELKDYLEEIQAD